MKRCWRSDVVRRMQNKAAPVVLKLKAMRGISSVTNVVRPDTLDAIARVRRQRKTEVTKRPTTRKEARHLFVKRNIDRAATMGGTSTREPLITCVSSENGFAISLRCTHRESSRLEMVKRYLAMAVETSIFCRSTVRNESREHCRMSCMCQAYI